MMSVFPGKLDNARQHRTVGRVRQPSWRRTAALTWRALSNRPGRSLVTCLGVVLGVAFLMPAITSTQLRDALRAAVQRRVQVQSVLGVVRAEVGDLANRRLVIIAPSAPADPRLLDAVIDALNREPQPPIAIGPLTLQETSSEQTRDAAVLLLWQPLEPEHADTLKPLLDAMAQAVVLVHGDPAPDVLSDARVRPLLPVPTERQMRDALVERGRQRSRTLWLVAISLLVAGIGIANALLMSVTERYREIGTMKCLGAFNSFVIRLVLLESTAVGLVGGTAGAAVGVLISVAGYAGAYGWAATRGALDGQALLPAAGACLLIGWFAAVIAAIYPAWFAARMVPADALRTEI